MHWSEKSGVLYIFIQWYKRIVVIIQIHVMLQGYIAHLSGENRVTVSNLMGVAIHEMILFSGLLYQELTSVELPTVLRL